MSVPFELDWQLFHIRIPADDDETDVILAGRRSYVVYLFEICANCQSQLSLHLGAPRQCPFVSTHWRSDLAVSRDVSLGALEDYRAKPL